MSKICQAFSGQRWQHLLVTNDTKPTQNRNSYSQRMQGILDYIDLHLDQALDLESVAREAAFSPFHFHRQFRLYSGYPLSRMIQLLRLKQASRLLALESSKRISDIALECGFENPESFSRAFRKIFGLSPSAFRQNPDWPRWKSLFSMPELPRRNPMDVLIVNFPETLIAALEHHGPEPQIYQTVQRFIEWRKANGIGPDKGDTYSLHYSDPLSTLPEDYRQDIAVTVDAPVAPNPQGVITKIIPAGRCAMLRYKGSREYIPAADYLYAQWLPASGEELRDFPFFFHYVNVGPDVRDANMLTDLYLPIK